MGDTTHVLYRFFSATGQLLYVGITMNPPQRFKNHRDSKDWWSQVSGITVENYTSRDELAQAERRAIQVEHPMHNIVHTKGSKSRRPPLPPIPEPFVVEEEPVEVSPEIAALFAPQPSVFASLFKAELIDTEFGRITRPEYDEKRRTEAYRVKAQARKECPLCDPTGYRSNGYLCDHVDHSGDASRLDAARRKLQKEHLRVVQGGGS